MTADVFPFGWNWKFGNANHKLLYILFFTDCFGHLVGCREPDWRNYVHLQCVRVCVDVCECGHKRKRERERDKKKIVKSLEKFLIMDVDTLRDLWFHFKLNSFFSFFRLLNVREKLISLEIRERVSAQLNIASAVYVCICMHICMCGFAYKYRCLCQAWRKNSTNENFLN